MRRNAGSDLPNILISRQLMRYSALFISLYRTFQAFFRASKPSVPPAGINSLLRVSMRDAGSDLPNILISRQLMRYSALFISLDRTFQASFRTSKRSVPPAGINSLLRVRS